MTGVESSDGIESISRCGVCALTMYWTPFLGSMKYVGAVSELDASEVRTLPGDVLLRQPQLLSARMRSMSMRISGESTTCWM